MTASVLPSSHTRLERALLVTAAAFLCLNTIVLMLLDGTFSLDRLVPYLIWLTCAIGGYLWLNRTLTHRDPILFPLAMFMAGWGLTIIERLTPAFGQRQTVWLMVGTLALAAVVSLSPILRWLRFYRYTLLVVGLGLLVGTILLGVNPSGQVGAPELWLGFGTLFFQPSELLKILLVAFLASYLAEQYPALRTKELDTDRLRWSVSPRLLGPVLLMWGVSIVMLIWQRDLGAAVLFFAVFLLLTYTASGLSMLLVIGAILMGTAAVVAYLLIDLVQLRIDIWLNPWPFANDRAYQIVQSLMAFGAGGIFGQGIGQGSPSYIPVVHSDFIFAALAEEWGLPGVVTVITGLCLVTMRGLRIGLFQMGRAFHALLAVGLSLVIGVQSLLIMGGVLKLIPLTGVTLPFFSYGGSSLVVNFIIIGLLLRLSSEDRPR